jgi:cytochrome P450
MGMSVAELQGLPLFEGCAAEDLAAVAAAARHEREIVEGEAICVEGDKADRWWIVVDGMADVTVNGLYTATIGPGETIGEVALLDGEPRGATVRAVTDMRVYEVEGDAFVDALLSSPRLAVALCRQLATRLRATNLRPAPPARTAPVTPQTMRATIAAPASFDPRAPGFYDDPLPHLNALREAGRVQWSEALESFMVTHYEDVHRLTRARELIGSVTTLALPAGPNPDGTRPRPRPGHRMLINKDGSDHMRLRRLMSKVFTPRAVTRWQERAETIVEGLLADARQRDTIDVIGDYAYKLPAQVITEMLGMPHGDAPQLRTWSRTLVRGLDPFVNEDAREDANEAGRAMVEYLDRVVADKRQAPADDILTGLLEAEDNGDVLDDKEVREQVLLLYIAGHETTLNLIGNGVTHLFRFPDQLQLLRTSPDLDGNAVEEVLRFESPAQMTRRITTTAIEVGDTTIPANSHITLSLASANHDPLKWGPTVDVLDIARPGANEHLSFGGGAHYCLGASLARLEAKIALPRLVRQFPSMAPAYDEPNWVPRVTLRGVDTLPVSLVG